MRGIVTAPCLILLALALVPTPALAMDGKAIYLRECAACHGANGAAQTELGKRLKPPARDLRPKILSAGEIRRVVLLGREKTGMHARGKRLSEGEVTAIVAHVLALPYAANPTRGRSIYTAKCARCHGEDASGKSFPRSPNLVLSELSDIAMADIIRNGHAGTIMGGMKGELSNGDVADLIAWLRLRRYGLEEKFH